METLPVFNHLFDGIRRALDYLSRSYSVDHNFFQSLNDPCLWSSSHCNGLFRGNFAINSYQTLRTKWVMSLLPLTLTDAVWHAIETLNNTGFVVQSDFRFITPTIFVSQMPFSLQKSFRNLRQHSYIPLIICINDSAVVGRRFWDVKSTFVDILVLFSFALLWK